MPSVGPNGAVFFYCQGNAVWSKSSPLWTLFIGFENKHPGLRQTHVGYSEFFKYWEFLGMASDDRESSLIVRNQDGV